MAIREFHGREPHSTKWMSAGMLCSALWLTGLLVPGGSILANPGLAMEPGTSALQPPSTQQQWNFSSPDMETLHILLAMGLKTDSDTKPAEPPHAPGQVLVRFKKEVTSERIDSLLAELELKKLKKVGGSSTYLLNISRQITVKAMVKRMRSLPEVAEAGANYQTFLDPRESGLGAEVRPKE